MVDSLKFMAMNPPKFAELLQNKLFDPCKSIYLTQKTPPILAKLFLKELKFLRIENFPDDFIIPHPFALELDVKELF